MGKWFNTMQEIDNMKTAVRTTFFFSPSEQKTDTVRKYMYILHLDTTEILNYTVLILKNCWPTKLDRLLLS